MKNKIRIIGGVWRGKQIEVPDSARPTLNRVRETIFNWLMSDIYDARCCDLFSGTGAMGLEALSRGAEDVVFIEKNAKAHAHLSECIHTLSPNAEVLHTDALPWIAQYSGMPFDIIFCDPPFHQGFLSTLLNGPLPCLAPSGKVAVECEASLDLSNFSSHWQILKHKRAGKSQFALLQRG